MKMGNKVMLVDALQCGSYGREVFQKLQAGGFGCVTPTLEFWGGAIDGLDAIGNWLDLARENSDLMSIAYTTDDIRRSASEGKTAFLLGFQNSGHFEGRIRYVELFAKLGVRVTQLTYNIQNDIGSSCYEPVDTGLSRFGKEVVQEMNRWGILIDCSHVGERTTLDAIETSAKPIAITHANAASLMPHLRNKTDEVLKALAARGGVVGCATYRNITPDYACATVDGFAEMIARTVDIVGIDHVGLGTDASHHVGQKELDWMRYGRWTRSPQFGAGSATNAGPSAKPEWLPDVFHLADVPDALARLGFAEAEVAKLTSENWLRVFAANFG
ncbi:membrane dipeptidase [Corticibacterium sp. UT-5YL-CI-8]|nr:membrane dipeptidase [Tianweitania sp. UT-5YL-CI-8]